MDKAFEPEAIRSTSLYISYKLVDEIIGDALDCRKEPSIEGESERLEYLHIEGIAVRQVSQS